MRFREQVGPDKRDSLLLPEDVAGVIGRVKSLRSLQEEDHRLRVEDLDRALVEMEVTENASGRDRNLCTVLEVGPVGIAVDGTDALRAVLTGLRQRLTLPIDGDEEIRLTGGSER